jgi:hypothetical protein
MISKEANREDERNSYLFLAFWKTANKFIMNVAAQILIARSGQCRKLLTSLVSFRMKFCSGGEKGDYSRLGW